MSRFNQLSDREWEVIRQLLQGKSNKLIASSLNISISTVEFHLKKIYTKLRVHSRLELILALWKATGKVEIDKLGYSAVDILEDDVENGDRFTINQLRRLRKTMRFYRFILAICVIFILFTLGSIVYYSRLPGTIIIWQGIYQWLLPAAGLTILLLLLPRASFRNLFLIACFNLMLILLLMYLSHNLLVVAPVWLVPYLLGAGGILIAARLWPRDEDAAAIDDFPAE